MTDTADDIVRALATRDPMTGADYVPQCALCGVGGWHVNAEDHERDCEWRRAVEWVEANPK
jgi:hypothetical protein